MKLGQNTIKKTKLLFVLDDVLAPGRITNSIDRAGVDETLGLLAGLQEKGWVELFLIAGQQKAKAQAKIDAAGLGKYFSQGNIFFVNDAYLSSKAALDRERHMAQLKKDPGFVDDFFTQHVLTGLIGSGRVKPKECCLVGHDLWTDAFYTARFSKIDFVLVRSALSERAVRVQQEYRWVNIIDLNGADIKKCWAKDKVFKPKMPKAAAQPMSKVLRSALANAKEKQVKSEALTMKTIEVMGGPVMKRFRAVSRGSAHSYKKRMTHIRVVLTDENPQG